MVDERELYILKKSILMLNELSTNPESVYSGRDYVSIHSRNLATINKIALERNSKYIKALLGLYPKIKTIEVDIYKNLNKKIDDVIGLLFGIKIYPLADTIFIFIKTKGSTPSKIVSKIEKIETINERLLQVIENPFLEEIYEKDLPSNSRQIVTRL